MQFSDFGLSDKLVEAIAYMGFDQATPIQEKAIPVILDGRDIIGSAQTGTGKTAAFLLPLLHLMKVNEKEGCRALIVVPTRELAVQIEQQIQGFSYFLDIDSIAIYGGGDGKGWEQQKRALTGGTGIIVATPGKLISHLNMGYVDFSGIEFLVLDEADRMLDMGFIDDLKKIMEFLPVKRQTLMFSATMPPRIRTFMKTILNNPVEISLSISKPAEGVVQMAYAVFDTQKPALISSLLKGKDQYESILIFSSTKQKVFEILRSLRKSGFEAAGISSDFEQDEREEVLQKFKSRSLRILVATDVLSRGIDIKDINLVINYDVPRDAEDYVHRIGRTARAKTTGEAITLVSDNDMYLFFRIEEFIGREIPKGSLPVQLGSGPAWSKTRPARAKNAKSDSGHSRTTDVRKAPKNPKKF